MREVSLPMVKPPATQPRDSGAPGQSSPLRSTAFGDAMRSVMLRRPVDRPASDQADPTTPADSAPGGTAVATHLMRMRQRVANNQELAERVSATVDETLAKQAATKAASRAELEAEDRATQADSGTGSYNAGIASVLARLITSNDPAAGGTVASAPSWVRDANATGQASVSEAAARVASAAAALQPRDAAPTPAPAKPVVVETPEEAAAHKPPEIPWAERLRQTRGSVALPTVADPSEPASAPVVALSLGNFFKRPGMEMSLRGDKPLPGAVPEAAPSTAPSSSAATTAAPAPATAPVAEPGASVPYASVIPEDAQLSRSPFQNGMSRPWRTSAATAPGATEQAPAAAAQPAPPATPSNPGPTVSALPVAGAAVPSLSESPFSRAPESRVDNAPATTPAASLPVVEEPPAAPPTTAGRWLASNPFGARPVAETPPAAGIPLGQGVPSSGVPTVQQPAVTGTPVAHEAPAVGVEDTAPATHTARPFASPFAGPRETPPAPTPAAAPPVPAEAYVAPPARDAHTAPMSTNDTPWSFMRAGTHPGAEEGSEAQPGTTTSEPAPAVSPAAPSMAPQHTARAAAVTPTAAPAAPHAPVPVPHQIVSAVGPLLSGPDGSYQLQLNLDPGELGPVRLTVDLRGGEVSMVMQASNADTGDLLRENLDNLRQQLLDQGIKAGSMDVGGGQGQPSFAQSFHRNPFAPRTGGLPVAQPLTDEPLAPTSSPSTGTHDLDVSM